MPFPIRMTETGACLGMRPALINLRQQVHSPSLGYKMKSQAHTVSRALLRNLCTPAIQASPECITGKTQDLVRPGGKQSSNIEVACKNVSFPQVNSMCSVPAVDCILGLILNMEPYPWGKGGPGGNMWLLSCLTTCRLPKMT